MATKAWAIGLIVFTTLLTSSAQILYKMGMNRFSFDTLLSNYWLIGGFMLYGLGAVLLLIALRGGELSVLYPIVATSYIWVSILSGYFFHEAMNLWKWAGIAFIIAGVSFIGIGGRK